jgi:hypothetical protein
LTLTFDPIAPHIELDDPNFWQKLVPSARNRLDPRIQVEPRKRKAVQRFGAQELDLDLSDDSDLDADEMETTDESGSKKSWRMHERARIKAGLLAFGYGRWYRIWKEANVEQRWSLPETKAYLEAFVRKMCESRADLTEVLERIEIHGSGFDGEPAIDPTTAAILTPEQQQPATATATATTEVPEEQQQQAQQATLESTTSGGMEVASDSTTTATSDSVTTATAAATAAAATTTATTLPSFDDDPTLTDPRFIEYLGRNFTKMVTRLELVAKIAHQVQSAFALEQPLSLPNMSQSPIPCEWWGEEEDRALLLGCYRIGYGRYKEIRAHDPVFLRHRKVAGGMSYLFVVVETERQRDRETERQRDRETERQRQREGLCVRAC